MQHLGAANRGKSAEPKQNRGQSMKTKYNTVRGWKSAANAASGDGVAFTLEGLPANERTARICLEHLLREHDLPAGLASPLEFGCFMVVYTDAGIAYLPLLAFQCEQRNRAELWAQAMRCGLVDELARAAFSVGLSVTDLRRVKRYWRRMFRREETLPQTFLQRMRSRPLCPDAFRYDRAVGVEFETFGDVSRKTLQNALPMWANVTGDGSITAETGQGHEVRALFVRRELEPRLFRLCRTLDSLGLAVNKSCGLHVHLDQRGETEAQVEKRAKVMDSWLCALQELVPASRRANSYCRFGVSKTDRYRAVNLTAFREHRTLEVRLHSGTTDYTKALAWIRLLELLAALKKGPKAGGCIATLEQLPLAAHDLAYWRKRHAQLNPHLYNSTTTTENE